MLNLKLDDWQEDVVKADGNILLCTGRQVGKTTIFSLKAARRMIRDKNCHILVVSLTEDQAQLIIAMILNFLEKEKKALIKQGRFRPTKNKIILKNGSQVRSRAVGITGNSVRGFTGNVLIVDEASRMPEQIWAAAKPTLLTTAGDLWICSTPFGRQGYFYECYENTKRFKVFHKSSVEVINKRPISEAWTKRQREGAIDFLEQEEKDMSKVRFGQEYLGLFIEELSQYFPDKLITKCMKLRRPKQISKKGYYYLGVDIARMGEDESVFSVVEMIDGVLYHVENKITNKTRLTDTSNYTIQLDNIYHFKRILIDDEGIGIGVFDILIDNPQVRRRIVGVNNSKRVIDYRNKTQKKIVKEELYHTLLRLMEKGEIQLLRDPEIFTSLKSVQYHYTNDKLGRSQMKIFGNYTHIAEALIRCAQAIKYKSLKSWVGSIKI